MLLNDSMSFNTRFRRISLRFLITGALSTLALGLTLTPVLAQVIPNIPGLNQSQSSSYDVVRVACPRGIKGGNQSDFQNRCTPLVGAAFSDNNSQAANAVQAGGTPSQISFQGDQATRLSGGQLTILNTAIIARLTNLRLGLTDGVDSATLFARNIQSGGNSTGTPINLLTGGAASADSPTGFSPLSGFVNALYSFGNVDSTFQQPSGFDYKIGGFIAGADYRYTDNLIFGAALSYQRSNADFDSSAGSSDSDSYSGSLYGTFYPTDNFYIEGIATYGWMNYDLKRKIHYTIAPNDLAPNGDTVNSTAKSHPNGQQYAFSLGGGYNYPWGALTVNPYGNLNYINLYVEPYKESGGDGWATHVSSQKTNSLTTTLGTQLSYAVSMPWGVAMPQLWGEWHHEFENDQQSYAVRYLGDLTSGQSFGVFTAKPDRDYFTLGAGVSGVFAHGVSAFFSYNALLGYKDISGNQFMVGGRMEF